MKTFTVYRVNAKSLKSEFEQDNYNEADAAQFEGVQFSDGRVAIRWCTPTASCSVWDNIEDLKEVHIYAYPDYGTRIEWSDGLIENL